MIDPSFSVGRSWQREQPQAKIELLARQSETGIPGDPVVASLIVE
jgi:hypothetical protein